MFMRGAVFLFVFLALFSLVSPAGAQISDEGASRLRAILQKALDMQTEQVKLRGDEILLDGAINVEKKDTYYAAQMPAITILSSDKQTRVVLGRVAVNAMPGSTDDLWKLAVAIPSPILVYDGEKPFMTISLGAQSLSGIWSEALWGFVKLDMRIENVSVRSDDLNFVMDVSKVDGRYDLNETGKGMLSGPMDVSLQGLSFGDKTGVKAKIAEVLFTSKIKDLSVDVTKTFREKMREHMDAVSRNAQTIKTGPEASAELTEAMYGIVTDYLRKAFDSTSADLRVRGVEILPQGPESEGFSLAEGGFGFDVAGFRSGTASLGFRLGYKDMKISPVPKGMAALAPSEMRVKLSIDQIPLDKLIALGKTTIQSSASAQTGTAQDAVFLGVASAVPALLSEAGTKITVQEDHMASALYETNFTGTAVLNANAVNGAVVKGRMEVVGIENVLAWLKDNVSKVPEEAGTMGQAAQILTIMQMVGQQGTSADGKLSRTYDFVMDEQGRTLLNGSDLNSLVQGLNGGAGGGGALGSDGGEAPGQ